MKVSGTGLKHLLGLTELRELRLSGTSVTDVGSARFKGMLQLRLLEVDNTYVTEAGVKDLRKALPACRIDCGPVRFARSGLQRLPARGNAMEADAVAEIEGPEEGLESEFMVHETNPDRPIIAVKYTPWLVIPSEIQPGRLAALEELTELRTLDLECFPVSDAGLEHIKGLTHLQSLNLWDAKITDAGLKHLKPLVGLKELVLGGSREITDAGVDHLRGMTQLRKLSLSGTAVSGRRASAAPGDDTVAGAGPAWNEDFRRRHPAPRSASRIAGVEPRRHEGRRCRPASPSGSASASEPLCSDRHEGHGQRLGVPQRVSPVAEAGTSRSSRGDADIWRD